MTPFLVIQPGLTYLIQTVHHWGETNQQTQAWTLSQLDCLKVNWNLKHVWRKKCSTLLTPFMLQCTKCWKSWFLVAIFEILFKVIFSSLRHIQVWIPCWDPLDFMLSTTFNLFLVSNLLIKGVPDEGYSKQASWALISISSFLFPYYYFFLDFIKSEDFCSTCSYKEYCRSLISWKKCSYVFCL